MIQSSTKISPKHCFKVSLVVASKWLQECLQVLLQSSFKGLLQSGFKNFKKNFNDNSKDGLIINSNCSL